MVSSGSHSPLKTVSFPFVTHISEKKQSFRPLLRYASAQCQKISPKVPKEYRLEKKKQDKKKPEKTLKEKRAEKKEKKSGK